MVDATAANESSQASEEPEKSNTDRLRQHLKEDGLGLTMLNAWLGGTKEGGEQRLLQALNDFHKGSLVKND